MDNTENTVAAQGISEGISVPPSSEGEPTGTDGASDNAGEINRLREEIAVLRTELAKINAEQRRQEVNKKNAESTTGRINGRGGEYFTADEVRSMSQSEVRANFKKIKASMSRW